MMPDTDPLRQQMAFIHEIDKAKYILRSTRLFNSERRENDAEHSWHLAVMALVLAGHSNAPIDLLKVLKMLLVHDLVEIDAGDVFLFHATLNHDNTAAERRAAERIFGLLPPAQGAELLAVWEEFETGDTPEARFARSMDRLEPVLQNLSNEGGTWREHHVSYEKIVARVSQMQQGSRPLWDFAKMLIDEGAEKGLITKDAGK